MMQLKGIRIGVYAESGAGDSLDEEQIKSITGERSIQARDLHQSYETFASSAKLFLLTNFKPQISSDPATWDRLVVMPFTARFLDDIGTPDADPHKKKYKADTNRIAKLSTPEGLNALLAWMIEGLMSFRAIGFSSPASIAEAQEDYKKSMDPISDFIAARLRATPDESKRIGAGQMYTMYKTWCEIEGEEKMTNPKFCAELGRHFHKKRLTAGNFWLGVIDAQKADREAAEATKAIVTAAATAEIGSAPSSTAENQSSPTAERT
jgi:putative DNA primase/helicase